MPPILERPTREFEDSRWQFLDPCAVEVFSAWHSPAKRIGHFVEHGAWRELNPGPASLVPDYRSSTQVALEVEFEDLADVWEVQTDFESVVVRKAMHPAYQRIIGLGRPAVPLILRRLQREPRQWFWALTAITGEDPADGEVEAESAASAWLAWGHSRGLLGA